jgi:DNA polymerase III alpha subunit
MHLDKYANPIFNEQDLFDALYKGHHFSVDDTIIVERTDAITQLETQLGFKFISPYETHFEVSEYDNACQSVWNMPQEYKDLDIESWLYQQVPPWDPEHTRIAEELAAFKEHNMFNLLKWLKYFVDTCRANNIVWGVGRGSSVASYVLYIIGVHKINSLTYNLD